MRRYLQWFFGVFFSIILIIFSIIGCLTLFHLDPMVNSHESELNQLKKKVSKAEELIEQLTINLATVSGQVTHMNEAKTQASDSTRVRQASITHPAESDLRTVTQQLHQAADRLTTLSSNATGAIPADLQNQLNAFQAFIRQYEDEKKLAQQQQKQLAALATSERLTEYNALAAIAKNLDEFARSLERDLIIFKQYKDVRPRTPLQQAAYATAIEQYDQNWSKYAKMLDEYRERLTLLGTLKNPIADTMPLRRDFPSFPILEVPEEK